MREKYESLSLAVLKDLAKTRGLKGVSALKKADLIERMLQEDEKEVAVEKAKARLFFNPLIRFSMLSTFLSQARIKPVIRNINN